MIVDISIIIVSYNTRDLLHSCLASVYQQMTNGVIEVIVIDNGSSDGSTEMIETDYQNVTLIRNQSNSGFSAANNQGLAVASGEHVFFLNPDTELLPGCIEQLKQFLDQNHNIGAIGPKTFIDSTLVLEVCSLKLLTPRRATLLFTHLPFPSRYAELESIWNLDLKLWQTQTPCIVEGIGGAGFYMRKSLALELGGMDERFFMGYEDTDLSAAIRARGLNIAIIPNAQMIHWFGQAKKLPSAPSSQIYDWHAAPMTYLKKHFGRFHAVMLRLEKILDLARLPIFPEQPDQSLCPNPLDPDLTITWSNSMTGPYLFEISNSSIFYDKFAGITSKPSITLPLALFKRLSIPRWFFRVVSLSQPDWKQPLTSGCINSSQILDSNGLK